MFRIKNADMMKERLGGDHYENTFASPSSLLKNIGLDRKQDPAIENISTFS